MLRRNDDLLNYLIRGGCVCCGCVYGVSIETDRTGATQMAKTIEQEIKETEFVNQLNNVSSTLADWAIAQINIGFGLDTIKMRLRDAANLSGRT